MLTFSKVDAMLSLRKVAFMDTLPAPALDGVKVTVKSFLEYAATGAMVS
jgi:hypothetical protein